MGKPDLVDSVSDKTKMQLSKVLKFPVRPQQTKEEKKKNPNLFCKKRNMKLEVCQHFTQGYKTM